MWGNEKKVEIAHPARKIEINPCRNAEMMMGVWE
jgi:hypothetical protein